MVTLAKILEKVKSENRKGKNSVEYSSTKNM